KSPMSATRPAAGAATAKRTACPAGAGAPAGQRRIVSRRPAARAVHHPARRHRASRTSRRSSARTPATARSPRCTGSRSTATAAASGSWSATVGPFEPAPQPLAGAAHPHLERRHRGAGQFGHFLVAELFHVLEQKGLPQVGGERGQRSTDLLPPRRSIFGRCDGRLRQRRLAFLVAR